MKIAILGYGKMGKTIERIALQKGHTVVFKASATTSEGDLSAADVAIEFSTPQAAFENIKSCLEQDLPVISGTTGWLENYAEVLNICEKRNGSFLYASNFSIGVNLFFKLNKQLAKMMSKWSDYDVTIDEIHHKEKQDAPSGTAISIAEGIIEASEKENWTMDQTNKNEILIKAERIDDVKGTHIVNYSSEIDTISIKHQAHSSTLR